MICAGWGPTWWTQAEETAFSLAFLCISWIQHAILSWERAWWQILWLALPVQYSICFLEQRAELDRKQVCAELSGCFWRVALGISYQYAVTDLGNLYNLFISSSFETYWVKCHERSEPLHQNGSNEQCSKALSMIMGGIMPPKILGLS